MGWRIQGVPSSLDRPSGCTAGHHEQLPHCRLTILRASKPVVIGLGFAVQIRQQARTMNPTHSKCSQRFAHGITQERRFRANLRVIALKNNFTFFDKQNGQRGVTVKNAIRVLYECALLKT